MFVVFVDFFYFWSFRKEVVNINEENLRYHVKRK